MYVLVVGHIPVRPPIKQTSHNVQQRVTTVPSTIPQYRTHYRYTVALYTPMACPLSTGTFLGSKLLNTWGNYTKKKAKGI